MTLTFEQAGEQLGKMASRMELHVARGLSYGLEKHVREPAVVETVKHGFGRRLWNMKRAGAFAMFRREPIRMDGGKLVAKIIVKGLPALAETGGVTKPHLIGSRAHQGRRKVTKLFKAGKEREAIAAASFNLRQLREQGGSRLLSFVVNGKRIAVPFVKHPGSRIAKKPVMAQALDNAASAAKVAAEIQRALDRFIADVQAGR